MPSILTENRPPEYFIQNKNANYCTKTYVTIPTWTPTVWKVSRKISLSPGMVCNMDSSSGEEVAAPSRQHCKLTRNDRALNSSSLVNGVTKYSSRFTASVGKGSQKGLESITHAKTFSTSRRQIRWEQETRKGNDRGEIKNDRNKKSDIGNSRGGVCEDYRITGYDTV
jgi:hypothetical protein